MRRVGGVAIALAAMVALAGCGGIPTSGAVTPGDVIDEEVAPIGYLPSGPQQGATPKQLIDGFIRAATSPADDYAIARQFLSTKEQADWKPNELTLVRSGVGSAAQVSSGDYEYTMSATAIVDADGHYSEQPSTQALQFRVAKNSAGQWRITDAPNGTVLSADSFATIFEQHALYFFDPTYRFLIPDVRWFPKTSLMPTRVVSALLKGQSPYLQQGVTNSEFPTGTTLPSRVSVESGVATVDLSEEVLGVSIKQRQRMLQQLATSIGGVSTVIVTVNGVAIAIPDSTSAATINPTVATQLLARQGDSFGFLQTDGTIVGVPGQSSEIVALDANAVTLSVEGGISAVRAADGVHVVFQSDAPALLLDARPHLVKPSVDASSFIWSVPVSAPRSVRAYDKKATEFVVDARVLPKGRVVSFALSRDGARVLVLLQTASGPRLFIAGVRRSEGVPIALADPLELPFDQATTPLDAAWVDDRTVATLGGEGGSGFSAVTLYGVGGQRSDAGRVPGGVALAVVGGSTSRDGLRVTDSKGAVYLLRGNSWADTGTVVSFLATQQ